MEKINSREDFVKALNEGDVEEALERLPGGILRIGNQQFQVKSRDLLRHYLNEFDLWSYEDQIEAGITPEANKRLVEFLRRR
jgi:hypothetical protein